MSYPNDENYDALHHQFLQGNYEKTILGIEDLEKKQHADINQSIDLLFLKIKVYQKLRDVDKSNLTIAKVYKLLDTNQNINHPQHISVQLMNFEGYNYHIDHNIKKALDKYNQALIKSEEIKWEEGIAKSTHNLGLIYHETGDKKKGLKYFNKSYELSTSLNLKPIEIDNLYNIGWIHRENQDYEKALEYSLECMKLIDEIGYGARKIWTLLSIARIYKSMEQYNEAIEYFQLSYNAAEDKQDYSAMAWNLFFIGSVYRIREDYEKCRSALEASLPIFEKVTNPFFREYYAWALEILAILNNEPKKIEFYDRCIDVSKKLGNYDYMAWVQLQKLKLGIGLEQGVTPLLDKILEYTMKSDDAIVTTVYEMAKSLENGDNLDLDRSRTDLLLGLVINNPKMDYVEFHSLYSKN